MKSAPLSLMFVLITGNVQACPPGAATAPPVPNQAFVAPVVSYAAWSGTTTFSADSSSAQRVGLREKHLNRKLTWVQRRHGG